ncbi:Pheromone P-factor receptor [Neolecta irregularis DAH-3]|uniref:Pheromone P-factor receptor n=1 Tax=Neolecta irregularis (strain DAH-3) TaxID=1198029 RepID=A0A1U7LKK4_NEOID|nr:Pheromone P-factor receptor [Neolecta irregularis DAH-3]|eukprot:OLL23185.1 Pheromone P-factor receptor [Neolecta irregularis DAH-3]
MAPNEDFNRGFESQPNITTNSYPPLHQILNISSPLGYSIVPLSDIEIYEGTRVHSAALFSALIAAAGIMIIMLAVVTKPAKRKTPVFFMNLASLIALLLSSSLSLSYYLSSWVGIYVQFTGDFEPVSKMDQDVSIAGACSRVLLITCIEISLVLQCRIICSTSRKVKFLLTAFAVAIASAVVILWIYLTVLGIQSGNGPSDQAHLARQIVYSASIYFFSAIFVSKLVQTIMLRRRLGLEQFGPIQIITIMGCQTMFVPALVTLLDHWVQWGSIAPLATSLVVLSLPLSSIWASSQSEILANGATARNLSGRSRERGGTVTSSPTPEKGSFNGPNIYELEKIDNVDVHEHHHGEFNQSFKDSTKLAQI